MTVLFVKVEFHSHKYRKGLLFIVFASHPPLFTYHRWTAMQKNHKTPCPAGPWFEAHLGLDEAHTHMHGKQWYRRLSVKWSFCWNASQSRWDFMEFPEVCSDKAKLLFWGFFSSVYSYHLSTCFWCLWNAKTAPPWKWLYNLQSVSPEIFILCVEAAWLGE